MIYVIIWLLCTLLTYFSWKGTKINVYSYGEYKKTEHIPRYVAIIFCVGYMLPIFNLCLFLFYNIWFVVTATRTSGTWDYWILELSDKNWFHRVFKRFHKFLSDPI